MSEELYVVFERYGRGNGNTRSKIKIPRDKAEESFKLALEGDDDKMDAFVDDLDDLDENFDYDHIEAIINVNGIGVMCDDDGSILKSNFKKFNDKKEGWVCEGDEILIGYGNTPGQAMAAFSEVYTEDDGEW